MYCEKVTNNKTKIRKSLFVWGFVLITLIATTTAGANASTGEPAQIIDKFEVEEDFGVRKALAMLGSLCDKNIVPSPNVDGVLAFRSLKNITFEEAMDAILGENFKYEQEGKLIKVYTKDEYKKMKEDPARMTWKVFTLYYISASEAVKLITPVLSSAGSIQASTPPETVGTTGESITTGTGGGDTMALNDTMVIVDYPESIAKVEKLIEELDIRPKQVLVEATILSATLTEGMELGIDLNFLAGVSITGASATKDYASPGGTVDIVDRGTAASLPIQQIGQGFATGTPIETVGFASAGGNGLKIGVTSGDFTAFITALEEVTDTTILANPKIMAINKQLGQVYIGTKIGYNSQTTQTQTSTTQRVEFLDTGTKLSFRPYIGDDGYIRMDIHPKDSSGTLKANDIPDEFSTELATNIMVKDGQTIVIGGLFRDVVVTHRSQIPLLGDLPLIGAAFRGTRDSVTRQEVIVLLTCHIIDEPGDLEGIARTDDVRRKRFGAKDELQSIGRARLAEDHYAEAAKFYIEGDNESAMKKLKVALTLRPSYLEAIRLKEKIMAELSPEEAQKMERIMLEAVESKDTVKWHRK
ncbi:MAG: secretin N-terminal domain-containing protein [Sedimentisphaerales bacterium]